jgi:hypothetical protein
VVSPAEFRSARLDGVGCFPGGLREVGEEDSGHPRTGASADLLLYDVFEICCNNSQNT